MSVRNSVAASAASRAYLAVVSIVMLPVYTRYLGMEAYGLVALFFVLQVWCQLLDLGLTPTLARETARYRAGALSGHDLRLLLRSLEGVFLAMSAVAGVVLLLAAEPIANRWLRTAQLPSHEVVNALRTMAGCIVLRLVGELYRGTILGFERLVWLAGFNAAFGTLRLVLVIPFLAFSGPSLSHFFGFQLAAALLEALVLVIKAYGLLPGVRGGIVWSLAPLRKVFAFALLMSLASVIWVTVSQVDKLILSGLLPLAEYGALSLAVAAAAGVMLVSGALSELLMPRLTHLQALGEQTALLSLYRCATQWAAIAAGSVSCVLAFQAEQVLWIWTGDAALARETAPVLACYALGNAALAVGGFPYYLQFARGQLRLHLLGTGLVVAALLPGVVWAAGRHGAIGAAAVWLAVNTLYLLFWTPVVHARFAPGLHRRWFFEDVAPIMAAAAVAAAACAAICWPPGRLAAGGVLLAVSLAVLLTSMAASSWARTEVSRLWRRAS